MNIRDLRIGNFILFAEDSTIFEVTEISEYGVNVKNEEEETYIEIDSFEGIGITEDWLIKFGFKKSDIGEGENYVEYYENSKLTICNWGDGFIMSNSFSHGIRIDLKYVHHLQNLYFVIIGKELELK